MKLKYYTTILFASFTLLVGCGKGDDPKPDGSDGEIWYPEKSQPGVFKVPDALKSNSDQYAKQAYEGVKVMEDLIATYSDYFLVPEGTKNTPIILFDHHYTYSKGNHTVAYKYGDFSSTHRVFELEVKDASGARVALITGDWWENWNANDGKPENGKHYGNIRYSIGAEDATAQTKEFSWIDDGGGNYRVTCNVWKPGENSGIATKYEYTFNADRSGGYLYTEWLSNGNLQYSTEWQADGSGNLVMMGGPNAGTYQW